MMGGLGGVHTSECKEAIGDAHIYEAGKKVEIWVLLSLSTRVEVLVSAATLLHLISGLFAVNY